jgi:hypothetical protein
VLIPEPSNPYHQDEILNERVKKTRYLMESIGKAKSSPGNKNAAIYRRTF